MSKKKLQIVKFDKKNRNILFREGPSKFSSFFKKYNKMFLLLLLVMSLTLLTAGVFAIISTAPESSKLVIKEVSIDTDIDVENSDVTSSMNVMSEEMAKKIFISSSSFSKNGEVLLVKTVSKGKYIINFYSDYTAIKIMKNGGSVTRINGLDNDYGISTNGVTNSKAEVLDLRKIKVLTFPFGIVTYYSDGSAEISNSDMNMYVRNAEDINENYISLNKVSYLKNIENVSGIKLNYYDDGTVRVIKNDKSYIVRNKNDLNVSEKDVTFKNKIYASVYKSLRTDDGLLIEYYTDGGAIITKGSKSLSVRKSNSIILKDNKIFEIVDSMYVSVSNKINNGNIVFYTNGSAVIKNYKGQNIYVYDNSLVKNTNNLLSDDSYEKLTESRNLSGDKISLYESIGIVQNSLYTLIVPKDDILFDTDGTFKEVLNVEDDNPRKPITITNNTNNTIKYRLVIDKSSKTDLDIRYIRYQTLVSGKYNGSNKLEDAYWHKDNIGNSLGVKGNNYILVDRILEPQETDKINVMLWIDYDTVPNSMQNKKFYGTLRLYAWQEIETAI